MRLINATTLQLEVFNDIRSRPKYVILSHRWVDGQEVTFEDMRVPLRQWIPGWQKIKFCCERALADRVKYAWVDTCCIDKSSSTELSEAINSMYTWYSNAVRCYAYLNDVHRLSDDTSTLTDSTVFNIMKSKWFTRAWTLQELIAPHFVDFYDADFERLASKQDLADRIEQWSGIPVQVLRNPQHLLKYPIAVRMSWAAERDASRLEDVAYSLFGLFEVNLPLIYGEGPRAFVRLQEEIIRQSYDHSIFAWSTGVTSILVGDGARQQLPLLASSPADFKFCQDIICFEDETDLHPYAITNVGLEIELQIFPYTLDTYVGLLACGSGSRGHQCGILLAKESARISRWHRVQVNGLDTVSLDRVKISDRFTWQKMHIVRSFPFTRYVDIDDDPSEDDVSSIAAFYGLEIRAPDFLAYDSHTTRPYVLVAYHDWHIPAGAARRKRPSEILITTFSPSVETRLSPSHTSLVLPRAINPGDGDAAKAALVAEDRTQPQIAHANSRRDSDRLMKQRTLAKAIGVFEMPPMSTGTAGAVFFDNLKLGIRSIKVGLNFNFHPVVFLTTHEADTDLDIQRWMLKRRYVPIEQFERTQYILDDFHEVGARRFWKLQPDSLNVQEDFKVRDDGSLEISRGIYAFAARDMARPEHWIFKPYQSESWHIALELEKRRCEGRLFWELSMTKRDDPLELKFSLA